MKSPPDCLLFCQLLNEHGQGVAILSDFLDMSIVILTSRLQADLEREGSSKKEIVAGDSENCPQTTITKAAPG